MISFHTDLYQQFHANSSDYMFNAHKTDPICVVVINYNSGKLLERCLRSLEAQTFRGFHAIVVDNGSTDESMNWLETGENRLRVIFNRHNIGFSAANNLTIVQRSLLQNKVGGIIFPFGSGLSGLGESTCIMQLG